MLNRKYRIIKDIETLGAGFIKERKVRKNPFKEVCEGQIILPDGEAAKVVVEYRHGHGTVVGPATEDNGNYERLNAFLNQKEKDLNSGYARRLRKREIGEYSERIAAVGTTLLLMANPVNQFVTHIIIDSTGIILIAAWMISLIAINKMAWFGRKRK